MGTPRQILVLIALALPLLAGGCASLSKTPAGAATPSVRDGTLLDPAFPGLLIEIDYIERAK